LKKPINTFIFEDLKESGYSVASRDLGLNMEHSTLVLERLAKFHAISMMLAKKVFDFIKGNYLKVNWFYFKGPQNNGLFQHRHAGGKGSVG